MGVKDSPQNALLAGVHVASASDLRGAAVQAQTLDADGRPRQSLAQQALRWTYLLRSRQRWIHDTQAREQHQADARATLSLLGLDAEALGREPMLVVRVPYQREQDCWEGRIFPWEYVLAAATREQRRSGAANGGTRPLTVIRELQVQRPAKARGGWQLLAREAVDLPAGGLRVLFVNALPSELRELWTVTDELEKLRQALPRDVTTVRELDYPSIDELQAALREHRPHLLHFAGMDSHQALRELRTHIGPTALTGVRSWDDASGTWLDETRQLVDAIQADSRRMLDGLLLRGDDRYPLLVGAQALARLMADAGAPAYLTTFNVWNSAARLAPMMVAEGASLAAMGFQDAFDDSLAEFTVTQVLGRLFANGFDLPAAFEQAWQTVRELPESVDATGVTLWVGAPVFVDRATREEHLRRAQEKRDKREAPAASNAVRCEIEPFPELNYAVLHNAQPLFKRFVLSCDNPKAAAPLDIDVAVHMGAEVARFQRRVRMRQLREKLTDKIHVPLTAEVARSVHEAINSSLSVCVRQGDEVLYHDSHRLRLLPVDQWRDNRRDGRWLPSFVLPRDPAVLDAVSQAQRYNRVLRDDPTAGFDGYQCVREDAIDEEALRGVDRQVEALWATLLHDWGLGYINPPPSYSGELDSQRLRVPSMVRAGRAGTCIDLALLFAACLELVDIYPVVFLLEGHALPGWWRHRSFQEEYQKMSATNYSEVVEADAGGSTAANAQVVSWHAGKASWAEVRRWIRERKLVPIETVRLTEHCGFVEAIEAGVEALSERADYDSMLDIVTARQAQVTPLPLLKEGM
jgi:hypothetical protein